MSQIDCMLEGEEAEVLAQVEPVLDRLVQRHRTKRRLWMPSDLLFPEGREGREERIRELRFRAQHIPLEVRAILVLNVLTEEGLPYFFGLLHKYLGVDSFFGEWIKLWTAEEDRHGVFIHDYLLYTNIVDSRAVEVLRHSFLERGFWPAWDDPAMLVAYTVLQEEATRISHSETGNLIGATEPTLGKGLARVASEEAKHMFVYREIFRTILTHSPDWALVALLGAIKKFSMPGATVPQFKDLAYVAARLGVFSTNRLQEILVGCIEKLNLIGVNPRTDMGRKAQERVLNFPIRLAKAAERAATKPKRELKFPFLFGETIMI